MTQYAKGDKFKDIEFEELLEIVYKTEESETIAPEDQSYLVKFYYSNGGIFNSFYYDVVRESMLEKLEIV